jgi:hypothetical protein
LGKTVYQNINQKAESLFECLEGGATLKVEELKLGQHRKYQGKILNKNKQLSSKKESTMRSDQTLSNRERCFYLLSEAPLGNATIKSALGAKRGCNYQYVYVKAIHF